MDWHFALGILSGCVQGLGVIPYVWSMIYGTTRPNRVTQTLWVILAVIQVSAQLSAGASWSVIFMFVTTFNAILIAILAFSGWGYTKYGWIDYSCFVLALIAIFAWKMTGDPVIAIAFSIVACVLAAIPAIYKTYRHPETESVLAWALVATGALLALFSSTIFNFANLAVPIYQFAENATIGLLAYFGQRKQSHAI